MNFLQKISDGIAKISNRKNVTVFLLLFFVFGGLMNSRLVGMEKLKALGGGTGMIDMLWFYTPGTAYRMLAAMGTQGRNFYAKLLGLDVMFSVFFFLAGSTLILLLTENLCLKPKWRRLSLLPVLRSLLDMLENCFIWILLFNYPKKLMAAAWTAAAMTAAKWLVYSAMIAVVALLAVFAVIRKIRGFSQQKHTV